MKLHTILGAGGAIADQLYPILLANNEKVRLVSRNPKPVTGADTVAADITNYQDLLKAIEGSSIVYLLAGLTYDLRVWKESWPRIMTNVINACKQHGCALIFFDNVYMYGKTEGPMTEETPYNPSSKKGEIRAAIASQLLQEMKKGTIRALIARAADFYGPGASKSGMPNILVFANLKKGKKAQWPGSADMPHSFTYVPDAARALYLLANNEEAFGQTWHLPTAAAPLTGRQFIQEAANAMHANASFSLISTFMMQLAGLFNRTIKELAEMNYQNTSPYIFNSDKFNNYFHYTPVSYKEGIMETAKEYTT